MVQSITGPIVWSMHGSSPSLPGMPRKWENMSSPYVPYSLSRLFTLAMIFSWATSIAFRRRYQ